MPTFEENNLLLFEYILARDLGKTVAELRAGITTNELIRWNILYAREAQERELEQQKVPQR